MLDYTCLYSLVFIFCLGTWFQLKKDKFKLIKERLTFLKFSNSSINKVVLCGGGANLNNIRELASSYLSANVRIGRPIGLIDIPEIVHTPTFSCLTGLLIKSLQHEKKLISNLCLALRSWLRFYV